MFNCANTVKLHALKHTTLDVKTAQYTRVFRMDPQTPEMLEIVMRQPLKVAVVAACRDCRQE